MNYYNEFDPKAAAWLRSLITAKLIPEGTVDERSITEVQPTDLVGYVQCHFFAGIGGWSLALQLAGWPADRRVWTGSCPCQPFSTAGKRKGKEDERHLWPVWFELLRSYNAISQREPVPVFGEQVASAIRHGWLDGVRTDLEGEGYTCGHAVLGAHSVGAPHIRQRLYWVANPGKQPGQRNARGLLETKAGVSGEGQFNGDQLERPEYGCSVSGMANPKGARQRSRQSRGDSKSGIVMAGAGPRGDSINDGTTDGVADSISDGRGTRGREDGEHDGNELAASRSSERVEHATNDSKRARTSREAAGTGCRWSITGGSGSRLGIAILPGLEGHSGDVRDGHESRRLAAGEAGSTAKASTVNFWSDFDLIPCRDGKTRRVKSGLCVLAHGVPGRVGLLRGYGNAIVPAVAAEWIKVCAEEITNGEMT